MVFQRDANPFADQWVFVAKNIQVVIFFTASVYLNVMMEMQRREIEKE
jgi:hypothetical protein